MAFPGADADPPTPPTVPGTLEPPQFFMTRTEPVRYPPPEVMLPGDDTINALEPGRPFALPGAPPPLFAPAGSAVLVQPAPVPMVGFVPTAVPAPVPQNPPPRRYRNIPYISHYSLSMPQ